MPEAGGLLRPLKTTEVSYDLRVLRYLDECILSMSIE
jgi:hypothetical protein